MTEFRYNPRCVVEVEGCVHVVTLDGKLEAWPGLRVYAELKKRGRPIHEHFQHYVDQDPERLPPLPQEDAEDNI